MIFIEGTCLSRGLLSAPTRWCDCAALGSLSVITRTLWDRRSSPAIRLYESRRVGRRVEFHKREVHSRPGRRGRVSTSSLRRADAKLAFRITDVTHALLLRRERRRDRCAVLRVLAAHGHAAVAAVMARPQVPKLAAADATLGGDFPSAFGDEGLELPHTLGSCRGLGHGMRRMSTSTDRNPVVGSLVASRLLPRRSDDANENGDSIKAAGSGACAGSWIKPVRHWWAGSPDVTESLEATKIQMDAFVVRKRPATRLFEEDRVLLVPPTQSRDEGVRQWILSHGGQVVTEASDATRIVVLTATDTLTADDKAHVAAARQRQPRASVLQWEWVRDCVEKNARLPEQSYRCNDLMSRNGDSGDDQGDRKKRRIESHEERGALSGSDDLGSEADVPILPPQLRPWRDIDNGSLYYMDARNDSANGDSNPLKIAAFDLDGTIIVTKSGKRFAENANDWKFFHPSNVKQKLKQLAKQGFLLVILSNQNGVAKGKTSATDVQKKMEAIVTNLGVQMVVLFATKDDLMRKPRYGAWQWLLNELNVDESMPVDKTKSFYCGDAAGRPKIAGRNKDFAATDYKLALNLQLPFFTPEALFLNATQRIHTRPEMWEIDFDPRPLVQSSPAGQNLEPADAVCVRSEQELIVLVGPPASGKSFNARRLFSDASASYVVVNQDELKSVARCKSACIDALKSGKSVVVDSTNRDPRARREWVDVAKAQKLPVRCFVLDISKPLAMHLNTFRMLTSAKAIPEIAIHTYFKNATPPKKDEGFDEIVHVRFSADLAALSDEHQRLLGSFL